MARVCEITGKRPLKGHYVSKSNRKTNRRFYPNLREKRFFVPELNKWLTLKVTSAAMRTIGKKGLYNCLKELEQKGQIQLN